MMSAIGGLGAFMPRPVQVLRFGIVASAVYCVGMATLAEGSDDVAVLSGKLERLRLNGGDFLRFCINLDGLGESALERLKEVCDGILPMAGYCCSEGAAHVVDIMTCPNLAEHVLGWASEGYSKLMIGI